MIKPEVARLRCVIDIGRKRLQSERARKDKQYRQIVYTNTTMAIQTYQRLTKLRSV